MSQGILTFTTIADALRAGYQVYEKTDDGYVVRRLSEGGWEQAHVVIAKTHAEKIQEIDADIPSPSSRHPIE